MAANDNYGKCPECGEYDSLETTDGLPLQGTCATEECPNDKRPSSRLCSACEDEAELAEAAGRTPNRV